MVYERQLREECAAIDRGGRPQYTVKEVMARFGEEHWPAIKPSAARRYRVSGKHILAHLGDKAISSIDRKALSEFVGKRRKNGASDATIRRDLACLSSALSCAVRWDWLDHNPMKDFDKRGIPDARPRVRWLSQKEYGRILDKAKPGTRDIVIALVETGLRLGELLALEWRHVDLDRREILIRDSKAGRPRVVPLSNEALARFRAQPRHLTSPHVFYTSRGKAFTVPAISSRLSRLFKSAKVKDFRAHDLRHTFASWFLQRGGRIERLQAILGHSRLDQTMKYAHLATADLHEEMRRVATKPGTEATDLQAGKG